VVDNRLHPSGEAHAPHEPRRYSPPYLWWRRRATQGIRALAGAVDRQAVLAYSVAIYRITRQHCGGVCRENRAAGKAVRFFTPHDKDAK